MSLKIGKMSMKEGRRISETYCEDKKGKFRKVNSRNSYVEKEGY
jgi:hypothetical protein